MHRKFQHNPSTINLQSKCIQIKIHKHLFTIKWISCLSLHLQSRVLPAWRLSLDLSGSGTEAQGLKRFGEEALSRRYTQHYQKLSIPSCARKVKRMVR